ncbi:hypothetical protein QEZ54_20815 [Catellatospora sp. KI3]|uniref:hypothetical protein n=1 Tax=Catellatospora sp. KI3 TaxID=3041620 RepID=UPI0024824DB2|nr:hypothetical protein [Catellatospora sp. KI3]MDI1463427.1 hypothetical protein [Catellatospora sp. KI3]
MITADTATRGHTDPGPALAMWWLNTDLTMPTASGLATRLTRQLVLTYTNRDDTVVSLTGDLHATAATRLAGRNLIAVNAPGDLATIDRNIPPTLITAQWPPARRQPDDTILADLLLSCRLISGARPATIAVITPVAESAAATDPQPQLAAVPGLSHRLDAIALSRPGEPERFLFPLTMPEAAALVATRGAHADTPAARIRVFSVAGLAGAGGPQR